MSKKANNLESAKLPGRGVSRRLFTDTFNRMLLAEDGKMLRKIAEKLQYYLEHEAIQVNDYIMIIKFLAERTDGRPVQAIEVNDVTELPSAGQFKIVKVEQNKNE